MNLADLGVYRVSLSWFELVKQECKVCFALNLLPNVAYLIPWEKRKVV